jgi:N4-gp56 family major capsid protein
MALGTSPATVTTHANYIPEIWADELRAFREINTVMRQIVYNYPFEGSVGDTIHVPALGRLTVITVSEGGDDANSVNTEGEFNGTITRHRGVRLQIPDRAGKQSKYDIAAANIPAMGKVLAEDLDAHILSLYSGFQGGTLKSGTNATVTTGAGADVTEAGFRGLMETLDVANVPFDDRFGVFHPRQKNVMLAIARFTEYQMIGQGNMPIRTGLLGELFGVPIYFTTNTTTTTTNDSNLVGQREAILLAMQQDIRVQTDYILQHWSGLVACDYLGQAFEFRDDHAIAVMTDKT